MYFDKIPKVDKSHDLLIFYRSFVGVVASGVAFRFMQHLLSPISPGPLGQYGGVLPETQYDPEALRKFHNKIRPNKNQLDLRKRRKLPHINRNPNPMSRPWSLRTPPRARIRPPRQFRMQTLRHIANSPNVTAQMQID